MEWGRRTKRKLSSGNVSFDSLVSVWDTLRAVEKSDLKLREGLRSHMRMGHGWHRVWGSGYR